MLDIARLRVACIRTGVTVVTVQRNQVRLKARPLAASESVRLKRLSPRAVAKRDGEIVLPLTARPGEVAGTVAAFLDALFPEPDAA